MTIHSKIKFNPGNHIYTHNGRRLPSVTGVVKSIVPPFDSEVNASRVAEREGKPVSAVLEEWKAKGSAAMDKGKIVHAAIEAAVKGVDNKPTCCLPEFVAWLAWWGKAGTSLEARGTELIIGDLELGVAGTLDSLMFSRKTSALHVFDWKTGGKFESDNPWNRFLLPPFDDVLDDELHRYSLQVSLYRLILERDGETGKLGDGWIIHVNRAATAYRAIDYRSRLEGWLLGK